MKTSRIDEKDKIIMMIFENNEKLKLYFLIIIKKEII